mgnify:CR=1 FL=1
MKDELKDKLINIIVKELKILKELTKEYYDSKNQEKADELLDDISWKRISIKANLALMLDADIITVDEWTIAFRLINTLI